MKIKAKKETHPKTGETGYREILPDQYSHLQEFVRVFEFNEDGTVSHRPAAAWDEDGNWARSYSLHYGCEIEVVED